MRLHELREKYCIIDFQPKPLDLDHSPTKKRFLLLKQEMTLLIKFHKEVLESDAKLSLIFETNWRKHPRTKDSYIPS